MQPNILRETRHQLKEAVWADLRKPNRLSMMDIGVKHGIAINTVYLWAKQAKLLKKDLAAALAITPVVKQEIQKES